mmetsp:Transcript_37585/g.82216  ORF Transcript_37585/g.82216 Transcript_37585/m.82216 type:complete len:192 (+) Transcript_37585:49-624(+)
MAARVLSRNIKPQEFISSLGAGGAITGGLSFPNLRRAPFWKFFWTQNFVARQHVFSLHHTGMITACVFFWWWGAFDTAPIERRDQYYMNGPRFRMHSAYANPGRRPAAKIALEQGKVRYLFRGNDHPFTVNEQKDFLYKLRENFLIQEYPGVQYPYVFKQECPSELPSVLEVKPYAAIPEQPHHHEEDHHH